MGQGEGVLNMGAVAERCLGDGDANILTVEAKSYQ